MEECRREVSKFILVKQYSVLWIRDILVPIGIRRSVPLTKGSGSGSFRQWDANKKKSFFAHYFLSEHLHNSSDIKSHKEVTRQQKSRLVFFADDGWIRVRTNNFGSGSDSERPKNLRNPTDIYLIFFLCDRLAGRGFANVSLQRGTQRGGAE